MAKRPPQPPAPQRPAPKAPAPQPIVTGPVATGPIASEPDELGEALIELAELILSEHFFDPDNELLYKQKLSDSRKAGDTGVVLDEQTIELPGGLCYLRIEALRPWTQFRVTLTHPAFITTIDGGWSFEKEELARPTVSRTGDEAMMLEAVDAIADEIEGGGLDEEEFADFMTELDQDDGEEVPLIGDDPTEPPEATALDRGRVKAIAKRVARDREHEVSVEDRGWLEATPQALPVITQALIEAAGAPVRDEPLITAYLVLLALQLEFVRYRQDRGWDWAHDMLDAFGQHLIALGSEATIPKEDWFMMCSALTQARVPVPDAVQTALADAGFKSDGNLPPPEQMLASLRGFLDELAQMVSSPFEVVGALQNAGPMLPAMLRQFMATELALSPHAILRDSVPILLLDEEETVRRGAAGALEQTARPETMSGDALRRAVALRNWIPPADRPAIDAAIRKARLAGVEIGAWPPPHPDLEFYASAIDGSGAQSILVVSRSGKKGFFGGMLLRHGEGVVDGWADAGISRGKLNKLLREAQMSAPHIRVGKPFVDTMIQNGIGTATQRGQVPTSMLLDLAELIDGADWKDRRLDAASETDRLLDLLRDQGAGGAKADFTRNLPWMAENPVFSSWFEDGPQVQKALARLPRTDQSALISAVMAEILPNARQKWAERFLLMALWYYAADEIETGSKTRDLLHVARALLHDMPLDAIPVMRVIAVQTMRAALVGAW